MLDDLKYQRDVITLESSSGAAALEHAVGRLPDFFTNVRTAFSKYLAQPVTMLFQKRDVTSVAERTKNKVYSELRGQEAFVPPGLKVDYLTYAQTLSEGAKQMRLIRQEVLVPFAGWLGTKLGNPASLAALTVNLDVSGLHLHAVEKLEKKIQICFNTVGRQEAVTTYGQVVKRNADWALLAKELDYLTTSFNDAQHKEIIDLVNRCTNQIDMLMQRMQEDPQQYKISPPAVAALANLSYQIACELEFYGLLRNRISELCHAVNSTAQKIA